MHLFLKRRIDIFPVPDSYLPLLKKFTKNDRSDNPQPQKKSFIQIKQEAEIQRLEAEIDQLDFLIQNRKELLNKHYEKTHDSHVDKQPKTVVDYRDKCEDLKKRIELTAKLSGVTIKEFNHRPLKADNIVLYIMKGTCNQTRFRIEFECNENHKEDEESLQIVKLDIYVPENVQDELQKVLIRLSENRSIWGFFQLMVSYSQWYETRSDTFRHFGHKYSDMVNIIEEDFMPYLIIKNSQYKHSPMFCVTWKFEIDQIYRARPKLSLSMKIPNYIVKEDKDHTLEQSPERFVDMVTELGIEQAIETIIRLAA